MLGKGWLMPGMVAASARQKDVSVHHTQHSEAIRLPYTPCTDRKDHNAKHPILRWSAVCSLAERFQSQPVVVRGHLKAQQHIKLGHALYP